MNKRSLSDIEASELLSSIWVQLAKASGETVHGEATLRATERVVMTLSAALTGAMDRTRAD